MTTSPMKADETESDITFDVLKKWNLRAGIVHLVQAVLMLLASQLVPRIIRWSWKMRKTFCSKRMKRAPEKLSIKFPSPGPWRKPRKLSRS